MRRMLLMLLIYGCSPSHEKKLYTQSVETHDLAIKIGEHVEEKIKRIAQHTSNLEEPLKSLLQDSVKALTQDLTYWQSTMIEVPGHEHNRHDHHDHNHDHSTIPDLTPEMMLDVQKDLRDRVVKLNVRAQNLLNTLEKKKENEPVSSAP